MNKKRKKEKLIFGWGINDADGNVYTTNSEGKQIKCPYYAKWVSVIGRCKSEKVKANNPTYLNATICEEWRLFSRFKAWVDGQPNICWRDCELDKDILNKGNKHYSPENCVFVEHSVNSFLNDCGSARGPHMIGVCYHKNYKKYQATCRNPFSKKYDVVGFYETEIDAHLAWKAKKHEHACKLAEACQDERVSLSLRKFYL